jgi:hypothetical protein
MQTVSFSLLGIAVLIGGGMLLIGGLVAVVLLATLPKREDR